MAGDIEVSVYEEISDAGFETPMVDLLLDEALEGQVDLMGDVLVHLVSKSHADWAAELCRMLLAKTKEDGKPEADYGILTSVMRYLVDTQQTDAAHKICCYILTLKENEEGQSYFDCCDLALLLGNMAAHQHTQQAADIIYAFYMDESDEGRMYHAGIPHLLGSLIDFGRTQWAVQLAKHLMLNDDEYGAQPVDYSMLAWCLAQMMTMRGVEWAGKICAGLAAERLPWFQMPQLLDAVASWSDYSYAMALNAYLTDAGGAPRPQTAWQQPHIHGAPFPMMPPYNAGPQAVHPAMMAQAQAQGRQQPFRGPAGRANGPAPFVPGQPWYPQQQQQQQQQMSLPEHERQIAMMRNQIQIQEMQQRIRQAEARGGPQANGGSPAASLSASMQGLSVNSQQQQQQQPRQQQQAPRGPPPGGRSLQAAAGARPFVPQGARS